MDELLPSLHYEPPEAISLEQNQAALFKLAHYLDLDRLFVISHALRCDCADALNIQLDLIPARVAASNLCAYSALNTSRDLGEVPLADIVNPLVITAEGVLRPLTYNFNEAYDLGNIAELDDSRLETVKRQRLPAFRSILFDAFRGLTNEDRLIDWFAYLTEHAASETVV